jgi:hypothetical protein
MVQDMLETEYYYVAEMDRVSTQFRNALGPTPHEWDDPTTSNLLAERQPLVVVPIPFSSKWTRESTHTVPSTSTNNNNNNDTMMEEEQERQQDSARLSNKRQAHDICVEENHLAPTNNKRMASATTAPDTRMEERTPNTNDTTTSLDWWPPNCLHSDANSCPVLAKLYYDQDSSPLKLNDVVELVGILSMDPMEADVSDEHDFGTWIPPPPPPPPSLLPRLDVLCYNRVNFESIHAHTTTVHEDTNDNDRDFCIDALAQHVFGGNSVAAEALLMACLSMAERHEKRGGPWIPTKLPSDATTATTLGCASLSIILSSPEACADMTFRLEHVLSQILPMVGTIRVSRESLGTTVVSPAREEHSGRLVPSPLQLPKGSALIIDESQLTPGPMEARAEETLRALTSLVQRHAVPYRFEGGVPFEFEADYRVVVVSQQQQHSSQELLLPCMLTLKLSHVLPNEATHELSRQDCVRIRSYLQKCRCHANSHKSVDVFNVPLSKHLLELAQHEFLDKRAEYRKKKERMETVGKQVEEDDLHRWLTLARLQARSRIPPSGSCGLSDVNDTERQVWADTLRLDEAMRLSIS